MAKQVGQVDKFLDVFEKWVLIKVSDLQMGHFLRSVLSITPLAGSIYKIMIPKSYNNLKTCASS